MKLKDVVGMAFTGLPGSGKSIRMQCLKAAFTSTDGRNFGVTTVEMSHVIRKGLEKSDHPQRPETSPEVVKGFLHNYVDSEMPAFPMTRLLMVAGLPKNEAELFALSVFKTSVVINIMASKKTCIENLVRRQQLLDPHLRKHRKSIEEDLEKDFRQRTQFFPAGLAVLNGSVLHCDESEPMAICLEKMIAHLHNHVPPLISRKQTNRALHRLRSPNHPVHKKIKMIQAGLAA